LDHVKLMRI